MALAIACARTTIPTEPLPVGTSVVAAVAEGGSASGSDAAIALVLAPAPALSSLALTADRPIFLAQSPLAWARDSTADRLIAHLHGICHPPSYSCGRWASAATAYGILLCPTGNARCGDAGIGPPSWEAASWDELVVQMDGDLERSIAKVSAKTPSALRRDGAVLTGWSRGGFAVPVIARMHPGRWPFLVIIEANAPLSAASLRKAGVRAVALLAGELGTEIAGERKTQAELAAAGFPAELFVMKGVAHLYPDDMDRLMNEALTFVLSHERD